MKRSGPPKRNEPLKRSEPLNRKVPLRADPAKGRAFANQRSDLPHSPIRQRSEKRKKFMRDERVPLIEKLIKAGVRCEIGPVLAQAGLPVQCTGEIQGIHERRKRSAGGSLTKAENLIPSCNSCNGFIEDEPEIVRHYTGDMLVVREGDPEYEFLGSRNY